MYSSAMLEPGRDQDDDTSIYSAIPTTPLHPTALSPQPPLRNNTSLASSPYGTVSSRGADSARGGLPVQFTQFQSLDANRTLPHATSSHTRSATLGAPITFSHSRSRSYTPKPIITFAPDRSPLQSLERELQVISKEDEEEQRREGPGRRMPTRTLSKSQAERIQRSATLRAKVEGGYQSRSTSRYSTPAYGWSQEDGPAPPYESLGYSGGIATRSIAQNKTPEPRKHSWMNMADYFRSKSSSSSSEDTVRRVMRPTTTEPLPQLAARLTLEDCGIAEDDEKDEIIKEHPDEARLRAASVDSATITQRTMPDPRLYSPPLGITCGPLLRYRGIRRERVRMRDVYSGTIINEEREVWRGSIMIVTEDQYSSYEKPPVLKLFVQTIEPVSETRLNDYGEPVEPSSYIGSSMQPGLLRKKDGERRNQYKMVDAIKLHSEQGHVFWRFNIEVELSHQAMRIAYRISNGPAIAFWVPAAGETMNIMFYSCNGFSMDINPVDFSGPDPLWRDAIVSHIKKPFHVMLGGGDQIYNDPITKLCPMFKDWLAIKDPIRKYRTPFTKEFAEQVEQYYLNSYNTWFAQGMFGLAASQIPMVNIWDDHDIIDGFGSYPTHFNKCPVFAGVGNIAHKYYLLFQHQSISEEEEKQEPSWVLGEKNGPYIQQKSRSVFMFLGRKIAFLGLDCRTERQRSVVVSDETYEKVFRRLRQEIVKGETKHLILMLGIPLAYPRLVWLENLLTSRIMDPLKALGRMGVIGGLLNNFDGGVEILDDLDDHWTARGHKAERNHLIHRLQLLAAEKSIRITVLGGDVHLTAIGRFYSNPNQHLPKWKDWRYMPNIVSSAIVNSPPPTTMADVLNKRNKIHHMDEDTEEDMIPIFTHDVDGKPRNNKRLLPRRNYCTINLYSRQASPIDSTASNPTIPAVTKTRTGLSRLLNRRSTSSPPFSGSQPSLAELHHPEDVDFPTQDSLKVTLRVEINQQDPRGLTKPYSFLVPVLEAEFDEQGLERLKDDQVMARRLRDRLEERIV